MELPLGKSLPGAEGDPLHKGGEAGTAVIGPGLRPTLRMQRRQDLDKKFRLGIRSTGSLDIFR
jgi:hypothetical protein